MAILRIIPGGRLGNQMLQYVVAKSLARRVKGIPLEVVGYNMPAWNLVSPTPARFPRRAARLRGNYVDVDRTASLIDSLAVSFIELVGNGFRYEGYDKPDEFQSVFDGSRVDARAFDDDHLLIHIRAGDIFTQTRKEYGVINPSFYESLLNKHAKTPVFIGELSANHYTDLLRNRFREAIFLEARSPIEDFETIRRSKHIVLSTSTFAWTAAWLSTTARTIHLPMLGFLDLSVRPDINLLPVDDSRYLFHSFADKEWFGGGSTRELLETRVKPITVEPPRLKGLLDEARKTQKKGWGDARRRLIGEILLHKIVTFA